MELGWRVVKVEVREVVGWGQAFFPLDDFYLFNSFP